MSKPRKGKPLGSRKQWFSGYSETRFFPGFGRRGRDAPLSTRGRRLYLGAVALIIVLGVAGIVYEIVRR